MTETTLRKVPLHPVLKFISNFPFPPSGSLVRPDELLGNCPHIGSFRYLAPVGVVEVRIGRSPCPLGLCQLGVYCPNDT